MIPVLSFLNTAVCTPVNGNAVAIPQGAAHAMGLDSVHNKALHVEGSDVVEPRGNFLRSVMVRRVAKARLNLIAVGDSLRLAGGDILLSAIDSIASEGALAAFDTPDRVLCASDYIRDSTAPTLYLDEVCRAVKRVRRTPWRATAEHLPPTAWSALLPLAHCEDKAASSVERFRG